jgi:hypothetical protein
MKQFSKNLSVFRALSLLITLSAIISRILARVFAYDAEIGYFRRNTLLPILSYIFLGLIVVLAFAALLAYRKVQIPDDVHEGMRRVCIAERVSSVLAFLITLSADCALIYAYWIKGSAVLIPTAFTVFGVIAGFFTAIYFLLFAIPTRRGKAFHMICGFSSILFGLYIVGASYFDLYTPMNNPVKMLCQITTIASLLFLLTDLRFMLDSIRAPRFWFSSTLALGISAVSIFTDGFFSVPNSDYNHLYHIFNAVNLAIFLYAAVRSSRFVALMMPQEPAEHENGETNTESTEKPDAPSEDEETEQDEGSKKAITDENTTPKEDEADK